MSLFPRLQRLVLGLVAALLLAGVAIFSLPFFLSEQQLRDEVTRSILAATGVRPNIQGEARLALLPRPAIQLTEVRLDDGSQNGLVIGSLQATVQVLPLLYGKVQIASLTLQRPRLSLEFTRDGKFVGGLPINSPMPADEEVPELRVVDGTVLLRVQGRERVEIFSNVQASLSWSGAALTTTGTFVLRNQPASASLVIADTSALARGERSALRARIEALPLRVAFEGGVAMRERLLADGSLSAESPSLRQALTWFDIAPPSAQGFGRFSLKTAASLTPVALALSNFALELDGNHIDGAISFKRDSEVLHVQGSLASTTTDLTKYEGIFPLSSATGRDWNTQPLDLDPLQKVELDLRLSSGKLLMGRIEIGKAAIAIGLKNRVLSVSIGEALFFGGTLRGNASLLVANEIPEIRIDASLANVDLERGLTGLTGFNRLEGKGAIALQLAGRGRSVQEIVRTLAGDASLLMKRGALTGINAELVLRRLERRPLSGTGDLRGGRTLFDELSAKLKVDQGVAKLGFLEISSPILRVKLGGDASIARREFDLRGIASLVRTAQGGTPAAAFELPFMIQGNWENPYLLPDPEALIRHSGAAAPLLDAVRGRAAREAMRNVIETVTGLQSIGELPANPSFEAPTANAPAIAPVAAPPPAKPE